MSSAPTTPRQPRTLLPTPPPTGHRGHRGDTCDLSTQITHGEVTWILAGPPQRGRKGILEEFEYLVARVENTTRPSGVSSFSTRGPDETTRGRPSACLGDVWWLNTYPLLGRRSSEVLDHQQIPSRHPKLDRPSPLFLDDDDDDYDDDDTKEAEVSADDYHPLVALEGAAEEVEGDDADGDVEMVNARSDRRLVLTGRGTIRSEPSRQLVPFGSSNQARALQLHFDVDVGDASLERKRTREDTDDEEDFAVLGAVIKTKYARAEDEDDREKSSTPLVEVKPCEKCGCRCGGGETKAEGAGGSVRRGGWSSHLSNQVKANILATLLGSKESLRDKVGGSVANWADLAEKLGADRGQHDTVRRVAKVMQERLPDLMRRGQI